MILWTLALLGCGGLQSSVAVDAPALPCAAAPATREVTSPFVAPLNADEAQAQEILEDFLRAHGRDIGNPWALGHTLLALGPDAELEDGRKAVDALFERYGNWQDEGITFPKREGEIRVEPHADLFLKALTETGVAPNHTVTVQGREGTLEDLYCASRARSFITESEMSYHSNNDIPWSLQGLAAWTAPATTWRASGGQEMSVERLTRRAVATYHEETAFVRDARSQGRSFQKRKQGIFQYTCGI